MTKYIIQNAAKADLKEIAAYTEKTWGTKQRYDYLARLRRRFEDAASRPHLGKKCDRIRKGYLSIREGRHIIFYHKTGKHIEIVRVIHESRDIERVLGFRQKPPNKSKTSIAITP